MMDERKVVIVLPAYNAEKTLLRTLREIPQEYVRNVILVDDASDDLTLEIAQEEGIFAVRHKVNRGYGANQKTCYTQALAMGADIVIMLHPDHQYDASVIPELIHPLLENKVDAVFGSRMLGGKPLEGGMPWWKYDANIFLTALANIVFRRYLTEIHSGFRAWSRKYLETVRYENNSDDFLFDTQIIAQGMATGLVFEEIPIVTRYFSEASSINFLRSIKYGLGIIWTLIRFKLHRMNVWRYQLLLPKN